MHAFYLPEISKRILFANEENCYGFTAKGVLVIGQVYSCRFDALSNCHFVLFAVGAKETAAQTSAGSGYRAGEGK